MFDCWKGMIMNLTDFYEVADSTSKCKFRQSFHKSIESVMQTSIFFLVSY